MTSIGINRPLSKREATRVMLRRLGTRITDPRKANGELKEKQIPKPITLPKITFSGQND